MLQTGFKSKGIFMSQVFWGKGQLWLRRWSRSSPPLSLSQSPNPQKLVTAIRHRHMPLAAEVRCYSFLSRSTHVPLRPHFQSVRQVFWYWIVVLQLRLTWRVNWTWWNWCNAQLRSFLLVQNRRLLFWSSWGKCIVFSSGCYCYSSCSLFTLYLSVFLSISLFILVLLFD